MQNFRILTLSDNLNGLGQLPEIIAGGTAILEQLFPDLFKTRTRLTYQDWLQILPGNGYWTKKLRDYYFNSIHYNTNLNNMREFATYFVHENQRELCGIPNNVEGGTYDPNCLNHLYDLIEKERSGSTAGAGFNSGSLTSYLPLIIIAGAGLFLLSSNTKKRRG